MLISYKDHNNTIQVYLHDAIYISHNNVSHAYALWLFLNKRVKIKLKFLENNLSMQ